jgi:cellulose synthase (UDP-forming)
MSESAEGKPKISRRRRRGLGSRPGRFTAWLMKPARQRGLGIVLFILGLLTLWSVAMTQLTQSQQVIFAVLCFAVFLVANRFKGRGVSLFLIALSVTVSLRYIVWRATTTLNYDSLPAALLGTGLVLAEVYAVMVLALGYFQTAWPLERKPVPLHGSPLNWPTVDVYVPTYNEDLDIVRQTVLAAMSMDYPRGKLNVYILDDGKRASFREFADLAGCGYIARADNSHAKAGNLNHAMKVTEGEFISIFDCDHIPTRAFLQMSLGWFRRDRNMALVQTPHHFYTLDPFEKNLATGETVPNEGNMFYGLLQPGNDFWNAAFFCGSCAILRRTALESIGGFAVQTVTEDAHTALRLQRNGWNTGYLNLPLAAGLATERLSAHIGQRARGARGMIQILRLDNPLFGPGLTLPQRLCYFTAMSHFLFPLPRLVFLTSPLAYLLFGENIITASPINILAYAVPHVAHAIATNSRLQRIWRHSFWSEVYETVLALTLVRPTTTALISPSRGKFNVTAKGTIIEKDYWDLQSLRPNLIMLAFLTAGLLHGIYGMLTKASGSLAFQAYALNSLWVVLSLVTVLGAIAVGKEKQQPRRRPRLLAQVPAIVILPNGTEIRGTTHDLSRGGISVYLDQPVPAAARSKMRTILPVGGSQVSITSRLLWSRPDGDRILSAIGFQPANITEETAIIRAVFGRADAWLDWNDYAPDKPFGSLKALLVSVFSVFRKPRVLPAAGVTLSENDEVTYEEDPAIATGPPLPKGASILRPRRVIAGCLALCMLLPLLAHPARAQTAPTAAAQAPQAGALPANPPLPQLPPIELPAAGTPAAGTPAAGTPAAGATAAGASAAATPAGANPASQPQAAPAAVPATPAFNPTAAPPNTAPANTAPAGGIGATRTVVLTLHQLGAQGVLGLRGVSPIQGLLFGIRSDEVVTGAILTVSGATSPALIPSLSNVTVTLNEQYVGTIPADPTQPQFGPLTMNINPAFFLSNSSNRLNFRFAGMYTTGCNDPLSPLLWANISDTSTLTLILTKLPPSLDLSRLPLPFFDAHENLPLSLPFVLPAQASDDELQAAGIAASWFGKLADFRGAKFPVGNDAPQLGNAVVIAVGSDGAADLNLPQFQGPTLLEIPNPNDAMSSLLVIGGRTGDDVVAAAQALAAGSGLASGAQDNVSAPVLPARQIGDAPNWIPTNRKVRLGELVAPQTLNGNGYAAVLGVPFQTSPDLYNWRQQSFPINVFFRAPPGPVLDVASSHLDVLINGTYLGSTSLAPRVTLFGWFGKLFSTGGLHNGEQHFEVTIPPYDVFTQNQLQFTFDTRPLNRGACKAIPDDIKFAIDPSSTIDFSGTYHFSQQPQLGFFNDAGYPFTSYADLSQAAVVMPAQPDSVELGAYLDLMGRFGRQTGYPAFAAAVVRPDETGNVSNRDLLILTNTSQAGDVAQFFTDTPVQMNNNSLTVPLPGPIDEIGQVFGDPIAPDRRSAAALLQTQLGGDDGLLMGAQSTLASRRTEIILLGASSRGVDNLVNALGDPSLQPLIKGDLTILSSGVATSYRIGPTYWVGWIPPWLWPTWLLRGRPDLMLLLLVSACVITAAGIYWPLRRRSARRLSVRDHK